MSGQKYKEICAYIHVYYPNSFCAMRTRIPRLSQEVIAFDKNDSSFSFQIKVYSFKESVISFMINFEFRVDSFCAMSAVSVKKLIFLIFSFPILFCSNSEKQKYFTKRQMHVTIITQKTSAKLVGGAKFSENSICAMCRPFDINQ